MDQRIFEMKLSVEATSLYLLMVPLSDSGATLDRPTLLRFWNSGPEELDRALAELEERGVIGGDQRRRWYVRPVGSWQAP